MSENAVVMAQSRQPRPGRVRAHPTFLRDARGLSPLPVLIGVFLAGVAALIAAAYAGGYFGPVAPPAPERGQPPPAAGQQQQPGAGQQQPAPQPERPQPEPPRPAPSDPAAARPPAPPPPTPRFRQPDERGDVVLCDNPEQRVENAASDITDVRVFDIPQGTRVEVDLVGPIDQILRDFSFAALVGQQKKDRTAHFYLFERHAGEDKQGAVDPRTGDLLPDAGTVISYTQSTLVVTSTVGMDDLQAVAAQSFNMPRDGEPKRCDEWGPFNLP